MYQVIVFIHVLSAIVAVGYNATYVVWLTRGGMERAHLLFALRTIRFMDAKIANPAYGLLLVTGVAQVMLSHRSWHEAWIEWAIVLWIVLAAVAYGAYTPALKRQIAIVEGGDVSGEQYAAANRRATAIGASLMVLALAILGLMVFRPGGA